MARGALIGSPEGNRPTNIIGEFAQAHEFTVRAGRRPCPRLTEVVFGLV
jgi:hypothetical protein